MTSTNAPDHDTDADGPSIPKKHWHFHRNLYLRYQIVMETGEFGQMLRDIRSGRAKLIERHSPTRAIYSVVLRRSWDRFFVLVDGHHVITAMPPTKRLTRKRRELPE